MTLTDRVLAINDICVAANVKRARPNDADRQRIGVVCGLLNMRRIGLILELFCDENRLKVRLAGEDFLHSMSWEAATKLVNEFYRWDEKLA